MTESVRMVDKNLMKRYNMRLVFNHIYRQQSVTRPQLALLTGLTAMSTGRIADELIERGLVREAEGAEDVGYGRPPKRVQVNRDRLRCTGVSLERQGFRIGAIDPYGEIIDSAFTPYKMRGSDPEDAATRLADGIDAFLNAHLGPLLPVIGLSAPGFVDPQEGIVRYSAQFRWSGVPIVDMLGRRFPAHTAVIDNDIKAWALAERRFGATQAYENSVLLSLGSGIGSAAVIGGAVYRGQDNTAGEIGHIAINPNARVCECGKVGCLQTNLTDWAILQEARAVVPDITLDGVFEESARGVPWARALIDRAVQYACIAVNLLVNAYSPGIVVLCGGMIERYPVLWVRIQAEYRDHLADFTGGRLALVRSAFGVDGGMIGAAAVAFERTLEMMIA